MFALFYTFLYINDVKKRIHVLAKPQRLCASERFFLVFNSFTVKKVNFFTINVKFKVILSSKSRGIFVQAIPPTRKGEGIHPPPPPPYPRDLRQWVIDYFSNSRDYIFCGQGLQQYCKHGWFVTAYISVTSHTIFEISIYAYRGSSSTEYYV